MTTTWREVRAARPPDVDRLRGFRIKADILASIEAARRDVELSQAYRAAHARWGDTPLAVETKRSVGEVIAEVLFNLSQIIKRSPVQVDYRLAGD